MSEMIERVARVLQDRDGSFMPGEPLDHVFVEDARAAIAPVREVFLSMLDAVDDSDTEFVVAQLRRMIDEALK